MKSFFFASIHLELFLRENLSLTITNSTKNDLSHLVLPFDQDAILKNFSFSKDGNIKSVVCFGEAEAIAFGRFFFIFCVS